MKQIHIKKTDREEKITNVTGAVSTYDSKVTAVINGCMYNAKSIMNAGIIERADNIEFIIEGTDEAKVASLIKKIYLKG